MHRSFMGVLPVGVFLVAGLFVAGCGSSSSTTTTTATTTTAMLTKAEFVSRGNAICKAGNLASEKESKTLGKNASKSEFEKYVIDSTVPNIQSQITGVAVLRAPAEYEATQKELVKTAQATLNELKAKPSLIEKKGLFASTHALAVKIGLTSCAAE
jgi:hypothetical protein